MPAEEMGKVTKRLRLIFAAFERGIPDRPCHLAGSRLPERLEALREGLRPLRRIAAGHQAPAG